jgi:type II secretory ATPase GspE/PulE/Tfp pilus assembly ATPase PilB-like protein
MLRCDPDVIMIGEVRDVETARIAVEAALTGHLVLATLHTNDAGSAIARLTEMGIEPFLITSAVRGVLAQRLVRRLCAACKEPFPEGEVSLTEIVERHSLQFERTSTTLFRARGCAECSGSGYRGRFSVAEALLMSPSIERLTLRRSSPSEIALQAQAEGMRPMLEDGLQAVVAGETSLDELTRVVH